jgi:imidazolonepropionase-like amidohydrolase
MKRWLRRLARFLRYALATLLIVVIGGIVHFFATIYPAGEAQAGYLALTGATALVGEELEVVENATILIQDGTIVQVGAAGTVAIPAGATTLALGGYTILPGLIDLHVHLGAPQQEVGQSLGPLQLLMQIWDAMRFVPSKRRAFLEHGVTTIRSLGDDYGWILELRRQLQRGELEGPQVYSAGPLFTTPGGHPVVTLGVDPTADSVRLPATPAEARQMVRELADGAEPVDLIKVVQERGLPERRLLQPIERDVLRALVDEAHAYGLPVVAHWGTYADLEDVLAAGVDGLQHLEPRGEQGDWPLELLEALVAREISLTPTLTVLEAATRRPRSPMPRASMQESQQRLLKFHAAGGRVVAGSDAGMPGVFFGPGLHRELELLVESGLTPQAALQAATSQAAAVLRSDYIGAIEAGRAADLVVVDGDPLEQIQAIRNIVMVFQDGRLVVDRLEAASEL